MVEQRGFFRPPGAWVGDVIPWVHDDAFHLYYLHETRETPRRGMPWHRVVSEDGVGFVETGEALPSAGESGSGFNVYTGSIVLGADGVHHAFSTAQNPRRLGADGRALQLVAHWTSTDGTATWTSHPEHDFGASAGYETGDWRDPFVFRDEEAGLWRMLIAARHADGPERRRGVIAQMTSTDLTTWRPAEPFWDPRRYIAHECPEVFAWNGWWYLVFSEFSDAFATRYRMSRSLHGPWTTPEHDMIDGRAFYAAKSAALHGRRFFFGWIASRENGSDDGAWQWAGTLATLEAEQRADGTLAFHPVPAFADSFDEHLGGIGAGLTLHAPDGYEATLTDFLPPSAFRLTAELDIAPGTVECGVLLRASDDGDEGYVLRLEPRRSRLVFDRWPRRSTGGEQWQISGDVPFAVELERPAHLAPGTHVLDVIVDGTLCVATLDGSVVLSTRLYDRPAGRAGVFVGEGSVTVVDVTVSTRSTSPASTAPGDLAVAATA